MLEGGSENQKTFLEALDTEHEKSKYKTIIEAYNQVRISSPNFRYYYDLSCLLIF
jgi:hypothetical protein